MNYFGFPQTQQQKNFKRFKGKTNIGEPFTSPISGIDISNCEIIKNADIINLHWVGDFLDYELFFKNIKKPIFWTLHDMNPFMGGFHYFGDLLRNKTELINLESEFVNYKFNIYSKKRNINVVSPSNWLLNESLSSKLLCNYKHFHIPYGIDTSVFRFYSDHDIRRKYNWTSDTLIFSFVSDHLKCFRKGFDIIIGIAKYFANNPKVKFLAIGSSEINASNIQCLGRVSDNEELAKIYSQSDAVLISSREDNLPNVLLESLACGTPVISFKIGGLVDLLNDSKLGILASDISVDSFKNAMLEFMNTKFTRDYIINEINSKYTIKIQGESYLSIYNEALLK
jgi:glycosyltransferase involved in cell wall biosynthesis